MQTPPVQLASALTSVPEGTSELGTQWAAPVVQQLGKEETSIAEGGAAVVGTQAELPLEPVLVVVLAPPSVVTLSIGEPSALGGSAQAARARSPETTKAAAVTPKQRMGGILTEGTPVQGSDQCGFAYGDGVKRELRSPAVRGESPVNSRRAPPPAARTAT